MDTISRFRFVKFGLPGETPYARPHGAHTPVTDHRSQPIWSRIPTEVTTFPPSVKTKHVPLWMSKVLHQLKSLRRGLPIKGVINR